MSNSFRRPWRLNREFRADPILSFLRKAPLHLSDARQLATRKARQPTRMVFLPRLNHAVPAIAVRELRARVLRAQSVGFALVGLLTMFYASVLAFAGFAELSGRATFEWHLWALLFLLLAFIMLSRALMAKSRTGCRHIMEEVRFRAWLGRYCWPWLTLLIICLLFVAGAIQFSLVWSGVLSLDDVFRASALSHDALAQGNLSGLFLHPFVHTSLLHLFGNLIALLLAGWLLECSVKRNMVIVSLVAGWLLGTAASLSFGDDVLTVGASGAISGLIGGIAVLSLWPSAPYPLLVRLAVGMFLVMYLLFGLVGNSVDQVMHVGGLLGGSIVQAVWLKRYLY